MADRYTLHYSIRSDFSKNLRKGGLTPGQVQYVLSQLNRGESKQAEIYMEKRGVTKRHRVRAVEIHEDHEHLINEALKAKPQKLGYLGRKEDIITAPRGDLKRIIIKGRDDLKGLAGTKRPHNPFWYHHYKGVTRKLWEDQHAPTAA